MEKVKLLKVAHKCNFFNIEKGIIKKERKALNIEKLHYFYKMKFEKMHDFWIFNIEKMQDMYMHNKYSTKSLNMHKTYKLCKFYTKILNKFAFFY